MTTRIHKPTTQHSPHRKAKSVVVSSGSKLPLSMKVSNLPRLKRAIRN